MSLTPKGSATRLRIIASTAALLREPDGGAVTLDDVRMTTSVSKGQLFHYFPGGKDELFLAVAQHEADGVLEDQEPYLSALDSPEAWEDWRRTVVDRYRKQGRRCPLAALMQQIGAVPGAEEVSSRLLQRWQGRLERGIRAMQEQGRFTTEVDPGIASAALLAAIEGGVTVLMTTGSIAHLEAALDVMLAFLRRDSATMTARTA
jgi:AcrR family transcriptional regulator